MRIEETLLTILKINSVTTFEDELVEWIANFAHNLARFKLTRSNKTLVFIGPHDPAKKTIALYGHTDTVINQQDHAPYIEGDKIFGCGASDMKGGLAVMLHLMRLFSTTDSKYNLQFVFYDGEEGAYDQSGLSSLFSDIPILCSADLALVLEPTKNTIQNGCLGVVNMGLEVAGKSGHSARPWEAENPIYKGQALIAKIAQFEPIKHNQAGLDFYETMALTVIKSGSSKNVIPAKMNMHLNYRFPPGQTEEAAIAWLKTFCGESAQVTSLDSAPSGKVVAANLLLSEFIARNSLKVLPKQAWTDVARLTKHNIDAVNFGPGDPAQAHQKNEHALLKPLEQACSMLQDFLT